MADGIPYPQGPSYNVQNPLHQMAEMGAMAQRAQAMQQQELVNRSKMAIGQLAQHSLDPQTGELDMHKLLGLAAQHPDAAIGYPELAHQALQMGLVEAQRHNQQLEGQAKELDFAGKAMASLMQDPDIQNNTPNAVGKIGAAFAQIGNAAGKDPKWATQQLLNFTKMQQENKMSPSQFVRNAAMSSTQGLEVLKNSQEMFKTMTAPVNVMERDPQTGAYVQTSIPQSEWLRRQEARGNLAGIGSAPPGTASRLEGQPSAPPAAPYGERSVMTSAPIGEAEYAKGQSDAWLNLRKDVQEAGQNATASMMQIEDMEGKLKSMGYRTGTFAPEQLQLAKAVLFFDPNNKSGALTQILDAKNPQEAARLIGAMEAFDKQAIIQKTEALRTAMGSANKLTNAEFKTFQDSLVGLRTSPEGIKEIYKYMEKLNKIVQARVEFLDDYEQELGHTPHGRDAVRFEKEWFKFVKDNPSLYKYEGPKAEGEQ